MSELRAGFLIKAPDKLGEIRGSWSKFQAASSDLVKFNNLLHQVHTLSGNCSVLGSDATAKFAQQMAHLLKQLKPGLEIGLDAYTEVDLLLKQLDAAVIEDDSA